MNALERAQTYASIFIQVEKSGRKWQNYAPLDGTIHGGVLYLQGVAVERYRDGWKITENGRSWIVRAKAAS